MCDAPVGCDVSAWRMMYSWVCDVSSECLGVCNNVPAVCVCVCVCVCKGGFASLAYNYQLSVWCTSWVCDVLAARVMYQLVCDVQYL